MWNKIKSTFKWIVKSNPKTIVGILTAIGAVITAAITDWTDIFGPAIQESILQAVTMLLGSASAALFGWVGFESNATADARKLQESAVTKVKKEEAKIKKLAELQIKQESEAKAKAEHEAKISAIAAQIKAAQHVPQTVPVPPSSPIE